jgi:hypothetical protein
MMQGGGGKVMQAKGNQSEVAQVLQQIADEYVAATAGLSGIAVVGRHSFITARMENMGKLQEVLEVLVGDAAPGMVAILLDQVQS